MMDSQPPSSTPAAPELVPVVHYPNEKDAFERAVVVLAMDSECAIDGPGTDGFSVLAERARADVVAKEIAAYDNERRDPAPPPPPLPAFPSGHGIALGWAVILFLVFLWQNSSLGNSDGFTNSSISLWARGEWWRPFTALFLHADLGHLLGNIIMGVLLGLWVAHSVGAKTGWLLIMIAGVLGNTANAVLHAGEEFTALGASTAVFGALGLLTGVGIFHAIRTPSGAGPLRVLIPLIAGMLLLAWFGNGGPQTDVTAHLFGFAAGVVLGPFAAWSAVGRFLRTHPVAGTVDN